MGEFTVGADKYGWTVKAAVVVLHFPVAVALTVITSPGCKDGEIPLMDQLLFETVVV